MKGCSILIKDLSLALDVDIPVDCCDSCHEDEEMGYESFIEVEYNGSDYLVCCSIYNEFESRLDIY